MEAGSPTASRTRRPHRRDRWRRRTLRRIRPRCREWRCGRRSPSPWSRSRPRPCATCVHVDEGDLGHEVFRTGIARLTAALMRPLLLEQAASLWKHAIGRHRPQGAAETGPAGAPARRQRPRAVVSSVAAMAPLPLRDAGVQGGDGGSVSPSLAAGWQVLDALGGRRHPHGADRARGSLEEVRGLGPARASCVSRTRRSTSDDWSRNISRTVRPARVAEGLGLQASPVQHGLLVLRQPALKPMTASNINDL